MDKILFFVTLINLLLYYNISQYLEWMTSELCFRLFDEVGLSKTEKIKSWVE